MGGPLTLFGGLNEEASDIWVGHNRVLWEQGVMGNVQTQGHLTNLHRMLLRQLGALVIINLIDISTFTHIYALFPLL